MLANIQDVPGHDHSQMEVTSCPPVQIKSTGAHIHNYICDRILENHPYGSTWQF